MYEKHYSIPVMAKKKKKPTIKEKIIAERNKVVKILEEVKEHEINIGPKRHSILASLKESGRVTTAPMKV